MLKCFLKYEKSQKRNYKKILAERKKRLESLAQVYIDDIHVMNVFFGWSLTRYQLVNAYGL
jgi:regulator of replication initiation timing